jgi:nicotinate dehydrogenase subunit B
MNELLYDIELEPERYEMFDSLLHCDRRDFFKVAGAGLVVAVLAPLTLAQRRRRRGFGFRGPQEIGAWIHIDGKGLITVYTGKVELGQNIRTSLTQAVAEELRIAPKRIRLTMADTDLVPYDMGTFGSQTTPQMATQLHRAAAAAREVLLDLAAAQSHADRSTLVVADGTVKSPDTKQVFSYGQLTKGKKLLQVISADVKTTPATAWKVAGTSLPKVNARELVTGKHRYGSDIRRPGMLHGKALHPPAYQAKLVKVDTSKAQAKPGVTVLHDGEFIGVAAATEHEAAQAVDLIHADWTVPPQPSSAELFTYLKQHPSQGRGFFGRGGAPARGSVPAGLKASDKKVEATYTIAYIAHVPLETRSAVAEWHGDKLTVWAGTQRPFGVRQALMQALGLSDKQVRVITPDTGSGYGGKHTNEPALEAARLARAAGRPVKVVWTRREEFTWAYFRPAGVIEVTSGVAKNGKLLAWKFDNYNSGGSALATPYEVPNQQVAFHPTESPLKQGSYRALAATANHFAREMHMDDLAHAIGMDPLEFRLKNLKNTRIRAVLQKATDRFGWANKKSTANRGFGLACGTEKGSYIASCAEVAIEEGKVHVVRLVTAFDCGAVVNPNGLKNQIEGAAIMGLGGALFEAIEFADGKIKNPYLSQYPVPRFHDAPEIEILLIDRKDKPSAGAGETPIVTLAPAVGNAIFAATGKRLRSLPMMPDERG